MNERDFLEALKRAIQRCELQQYVLTSDRELASAKDHWSVAFDVKAIKSDQASPGGLKLSHGQRRMLQILITLWKPRLADEIFSLPLSELVPTVMSMDRENREILAELLYSFPGWGD